ncbi:MAG: hypothetical protein IJE21_03735 [Alistipes sp.]|nr:hypothetical protein [Alistipes sp.]
MKRLFLPILLAAIGFVGCSQSDMTEIAPEIQMGTTDFGVGAGQGNESRASYDEDLKFFWEAGDEIAVLQDCVGGYQQSLTLFDGEMTNEGFFRNTSYEYVMGTMANFHFVYPASLANLASKSIALPAQDGVWTPILVASTDKANIKDLQSVKLQSIAGALAIRVFQNDKKTPYRVKTVTVSGTKPFLGEFVGVLDAEGKMTYTPSATESSFTANVEGIELNADNNYEYRFEVLPVTAGVVTVTLTDVDGNVITLSTSGEKTFKVNTRTAVNVAWDPTLSIGEVTSWYEEAVANGSSSIAPSTIYIKGVKSNGGIGSPKILLDGSVYPHTTLSDGTYVLSNVPSGEHTVRATVGQPDGSSETTDAQTVQVTTIPTVSYTARSTYAYNNGTKVRENNESNRTSILFEGMTISGSDDYTTSKLNLSNVAFVYGSSSATVSSSASSASPTRIDNVAVGAYSCYVKVPLSANAKVTISSPASTIYVTGLPLSVSGAKDNYTNNGWSISSYRDVITYFAIYNNETITSPQLYMPNDSFTTDLDGSRSSGTGGSISVGPVNGSKVSMTINSSNNYTATVTLNGLDNIRYTISLSGTLVSLRYVDIKGVEFRY